MNIELKTKQESIREAIVERVVGLDENVLKNVLLLEEKCFPVEWQYGAEAVGYYKEKLENPANISIFLKIGDEVVGYILLVPHGDVAEELEEYDPSYEKKENTYYIETIQILPEKRGIGGARKLLVAGCEEANKIGINSFSIHARTLNGLHDRVKKIFEGKIDTIRKIDKWQPAQGESYEYIEWHT